jgi:PAS domain S-box-containing protein
MIQVKQGNELQGWSVYILRCRGGSLYTGIAKDVPARVRQHNAGRGAAYTRTRLPVQLLYREDRLTRSEALVREAEIKRLPRARKEEIILGRDWEMNDKKKTKEQLLQELEALRRRVADFEKLETRDRQLPEPLADRELTIQNIINNFLSAMIYQVIRKDDGTRVFTYLSDTVRQFYGITPEEGLADAQLIYDQVWEEDRMRVFREEEEANRTRTPFRSEVRMMDPGGGMRWSLFVSHPRLLADGSVCWDGIEFDITERKKAEEALRESEEKFSKIFRTIPDAVAIARSSDGVYVDVNEGYSNVSGYSREELIGRSALPGDLDLWLCPEDREPFVTALRQTGQALGFEFRFRRKDGAIRNGLLSARVLDIHGEMCHVAIISDITARKQAEEALRSSEEKFSRIFKTIPDPVCIIRLADGIFLDVNESFVRVSGYPKEEILGRPYYSANPGLRIQRQDRARVLKALRQTGEVHGIDALFRGRGGKEIYGLISARTLEINGEACMVGIVNDITEQKRAEEAMLRTQKQLQLILNTVPALMWQKDREGRYVAVNKAVCRQLGLAEEDILGRTAHELFPADMADLYVCADRRIRESGRAELGRIEPHQKTTGELGWSHVDRLVYHDHQGKVAGTLGYALDITERKGIEEKLSRSEEKFRTIFENNSSAMALIEPDSTFSMVNDAFCHITGFTKEEVIGMSWRQMIPPEDLGRMEEYNRRRFVNPQEVPAKYEFTFYRKSGEIRNGLISASLIPSNRQLIVSVNDITELKQAEKDLKKSREMLRALSAHLHSVREEERANISREIHDDLGQLLTGLKIDLSWLLRHPLPSASELREKVETMSQLIDQTVQTVRRISTELRPRILDDFGLVAALDWQAEEFTKKTGITCLFRSTGQQLDAHPDWAITIFRIFQEALTNVVRHSGASQVEAVLKKNAQGLVLTIRDNGRGISVEEPGQSNSLGLVGMRERALIVGGTIEIRGKKGKGTTVILRLPVSAQEPARPSD